MLEITPQEFNVSPDILSQIEKQGRAKFVGENGHSFYIYPQDAVLSFNSAEEVRSFGEKELKMSWQEIKNLADDFED